MESMYNLYFYGGLALAIIFLITSVVLFFVLKIPKVIGDLTGRTAKRSIDEMKNKKSSSSAVSKKEQAKYYNQGTGKIKVKESVSPAKRKENRDDTTDLLGSNKKGKNYDPDQTEVLGASGVADIDEEATAVLSANGSDEEATDVLRINGKSDVDEESTDVLKSDDTNDADDDAATDVLKSDDSDESTNVLTSTDEDDDESTDVLRSDANASDADDERDEDATDVLRAVDVDDNDDDDEPATDVLRADMIKNKKSHNSTVICDIVVTHTNESV